MPALQSFIISVAADAVPACINTGVWPSVVIAQGIQESGSGSSPLARYNNLFGHLATAAWFGKWIQLVPGGKHWRAYDSVDDCIKAHVGILKHARYIVAGVITAKTPYQQAIALQNAGYDDGPDKGKYADKLDRIIRENNLQVYDKQLQELERKVNTNGLAYHEQSQAQQIVKSII